jgi:hypothetical protein
MNTCKKLFAVAVLTFGLALPAAAQFGSPLGDRGPRNESFGGNYKDPQLKAAEHLAKGLRFKEKADKETDAKKREKLLDRAWSELQSSNALHPNHDALVAMGQIAIDRGNRKAAMDSCWQALGLDKNSQTASACYQEAKGMAVATQPGPGSPSGN